MHTYEYLGGLLMHETRGEQAYNYYYDANGQLYAVSYKLSDTDTKKVYYFTHNWRGDIVGIYNGNGDLKATYEYDAWGNVTAIEDANGNAITSATHIANLNPFRYRGYYQDTETGLYYLLSRYYDPVTHRFINADGLFQAGNDVLSTNMNIYCGNNPIMFRDPSGMCYEYGPLPGAVMGNKWVQHGTIPGTSCCARCNGATPGTHQWRLQQQPAPVPPPSTNKYFDTIDNAATDFVLRYGAVSIESCREYGAPINIVEYNGQMMYTYPDEPFIGPVRTDANGSCAITWDQSAVAIVHTHGQFVVDENNDFSPGDKAFQSTYSAYNLSHIYVGTPAGQVRKYNFASGTNVSIFENAPRDLRYI